MVLRLQLGGTVNTSYFADPVRSQAALKGASTSTKSDEGLISLDLLKLLKGIPVDVDDLMSTIADIEYKASMGMPVSSKTVRAIEARINQVVQQSEYLKEAETRAVKNDAIGEVAVGDRGELFTVGSDGDIKKISIGDYNIEKHGPALTVNELIQQRKFNPTLAYDTLLTLVIGSNVGMAKISEYVQELLKTVGSSETVNEAYTDLAGIVGREAAKKPTHLLLQTILLLYLLSQSVGMDAVFKEKTLMSSKNVQEAFKYIQNLLPRNMRLLLQARFVASGNSLKDSGEYVSHLIGDAIMANNDSKVHYNIDYETGVNQHSTSKGLNRNLGVLELLVLGSLGKRSYKLMNSENPEFSLNLHGSGVGSLATFNNTIVDKTPLSVALKSGLAPLVDEEHIMIGGQKAPIGAFDTILYNGGDVINIWAPVNSEGDIDLEGLQILSEILNVCDNNPNLTTEDKNNMLRKYHMEGYFDEQGTFHGTGLMAQFLVMTGLTSDEVVDPKLNPFIDKLSKDEKRLEFQQLERIYGSLNKGLKSGKYEFLMGMFKGTTNLYKVPIFMRLNLTAQIDAGTFSDKGPLVQTPTYLQLLAYDLTRSHNLRSLTTPSTLALYE